MLRRSLATTTLALCALAGCQDYNFNPVGKCVIQPGAARIKLANVSTADVLFVVDDSGSMASEQASLARNFTAFTDALKATQADRIAQGLEPFEFHIAVTTSSVFEGWQPAAPVPTCGGTPQACNIPRSHYSLQPVSEACTDAGATCTDLVENYNFLGCTAGVGANGARYPQGDFVAAAGNPRVLHFTKGVWTGDAAANASLATLIAQFQGNINVGTCGSGMEQHLEAGRLALQKALQQNGLKQPVDVSPTDWPHPGAKLVVVWVGDEDDCSNPNDPTKSLGFTAALSSPGADVCTQDEFTTPVGQKRLFPVQDYADYFTGLQTTFTTPTGTSTGPRPFGAAFIYSAVNCRDDGTGNIVCDAGTCACQCPASCASCSPTASGICQIPADCSGKSTGTRFHDLSAALRVKGVSTLDASVCDANFGTTLQRIAELVKPPAGLTLPTQPASTQVAVLRIESADGKSSRFCAGPAVGQDWWFVDCRTGQAVPDGTTSTCITLNPASTTCKANPGETFIAQYLGLVPPSGCKTKADCTAALGGSATAWSCTAEEAGFTGGVGTCLCAGQ